MNAATKKTWRVATVFKDRAALIDGAEFENPDFKDFLPHLLNLLLQLLSALLQFLAPIIR